MKELSRRTGLNLIINTAPVSVYGEKAKVIMASKKNLPDIISGVDVNDLGMQGAFEPIEQNLKELPNFKEIFYDKTEKYNTVDLIKGLKAQDGNIYTWPVWDIQREVNHGMLYRKDIFDKHNIPMWNGPNEFYEALKKLKSIYPDSTPLTSKTKTTIFIDFGGMWNIRSIKPWIPYYDEDTKLWKHCLTDPKMKEILDYLKKLYDEKLLDAEFLTLTEAAWTSKMTQNEKAFTTFDWIGRLDMFKEQTSETIPEYDLRYGNPIGPEGKVRTLDKIWGSFGVVKSSKSLLALKLLDYTISESGAQLLTMGIEGVTFEKDNDKFKYLGYNEVEKPTTSNLGEKYGLFSDLANRYDKRSVYYDYTQREQEAQDIIKNKEGGGFFPFDPILIFAAEEMAEKNEIEPKLQKAAEEFFTQYILTTDTGDSAWNAWLEKAKGIGSEKVVEIYNQAQKRYDEEK